MALTEKERKILYSIRVASENDPHKPEFPPDHPKFPATPTYKIKVPGFTNIYLKDESVNPTGTHKDRMAWEMVVTHRNFLLAKKNTPSKAKLPHMSLITSGAAGIAVQTALRKYKLPNLKCLVDVDISPEMQNSLESLGCYVYHTDLSRKPLTSREILELTENTDGIDITSSKGLDPLTRFYDWMSYEIIDQNPAYVFVPFGSGNLYQNILNVNKKEVLTTIHDPRFSGDVKILRNCNFIGASVENPDSKAEKLYAPFKPFIQFNDQWLKICKLTGACGPQSAVHTLQERFLDKAIHIAAEQGITFEPSGIAGLAMLLQMPDIPKDKKILIVNTGKTKKP